MIVAEATDAVRQVCGRDGRGYREGIGEVMRVVDATAAVRSTDCSGSEAVAMQCASAKCDRNRKETRLTESVRSLLLGLRSHEVVHRDKVDRSGLGGRGGRRAGRIETEGE